MSSVGAALPHEMARVARLLPVYASVDFGQIAIEFMLSAIDRAAEAIATQDIVGCLRSYEELTTFHA